LLLKRDITSQVIDPAKIIEQGKDYTYSLTNIAVAMLAKLGGTPWRLDTPIKNELIVGIGAFRHPKDKVQYLGSTFSFDNTGGFNNFDYFMKHQTDELAGCIEEKVKEFASINHAPDRLIIHFYKELSRKELIPIEKASHHFAAVQVSFWYLHWLFHSVRQRTYYFQCFPFLSLRAFF
jgi:argonaute-like protein implicated in RNA metabolism and viral defense